MIKRQRIENVFGKTFADSFDVLVMDLGPRLNFTKREMVEDLGCPNFAAATRLNRVLKRLGISTPAQLQKLDAPSLIRVRGIGTTSLFVVQCIFDYLEADFEAWWGYRQDNVVKFSTFKAKAIARAKKRRHVA